MMEALYHTIMAVPVMNEQSPLEPVIYTAIGIFFPIALLFFLRKKESGSNTW